VEIKVNPNTIQRAYEALEREGVVETRRGIGVFVLNSSRSQWSAFEKKLSLQFQQSIRQGIKEGLQPDKIRRLFESAMHEFLKGAAR
jgi:GntR family transcriptional regulator